MSKSVFSCIGFGSNVGDRYATWDKTLLYLAEVPGLRIIYAATPMETKPVGPITDQPDFLNSVITVETTLDPLALLDQLLHIEQRLGRVRRERWGPRTVDLDILTYGDQTINEARLQVPHPEIKNRPFLSVLMKEFNAYQDSIKNS